MTAVNCARDLHKVRRRVRNSNLLVISDTPSTIKAALDSVARNTALLESYIRRRPDFRTALSPISVEAGAPQVARMAAEAAEIAGVGPFAAITGALAEMAMTDMVSAGAKICVVENGGEIAALSSLPLDVAVYAGPSALSCRVGFHLTTEDFPIGIATSSATVSDAVNFGLADAAVVVADSATMADAAAKTVCNAVTGEDAESSVQKGLEVAKGISNIRGALVVRGKHVGVVGRLPKLVKIEGSTGDVLTAALYDPKR